jgi:thiamine pyrophosphate-dependent acetolactate synthase large subunit-like protein
VPDSRAPNPPAPNPPREEPRPRVETPVAHPRNAPAWTSDAIAETIRALGLRYLALNPGASYRGLHDSLVNHLGNSDPQMLLCLHEEVAVALAHGYAKVAGAPMGVVLHSNVGLMHATMALFNAWCDRVPVLAIGATGPLDAMKRRPWIDWIHTATDQAALIRPYTKWDNQPTSLGAAQEALLRANLLCRTAPCGPTYVCLDAALQESPLETPVPPPQVERFRAPPPAHPAPHLIDEAAQLLAGAARPAILMGRVSRDEMAWIRRVELAIALDADVITDLKTPAAFPTEHPLHAAPAGSFLHPRAAEVLRDADVVLSLDWVDLGGTLRSAGSSAKVIQASLDQTIHNGWSMDHQALPPVDVHFLNDPDVVVAPLLKAMQARPARTARPRPPQALAPEPTDDAPSVVALAAALRRVVAGRETTLIRAPLSWSGELWPIRGPLDFLGYDGGGGIGSGPGMAVGAALALMGTRRLPVAVTGDGDLLMGVTALWTAARYRIPVLIVVANNRSFYNDELHQERVARQRGRPIENKWIGQAMIDPDIDLAALARAQGCVGIGPVTAPEALDAALAEAIAAVDAGRPCLVDVRVLPGYAPPMASAVVRGS